MNWEIVEEMILNRIKDQDVKDVLVILTARIKLLEEELKKLTS